MAGVVPVTGGSLESTTLDVYLALLSVTNDILTYDTDGWTSVTRFLQRWQERTGTVFTPSDFGFAEVDEFVAHLQRQGLAYAASTATGEHMLCPRAALAELAEPASDIQEAIRRYLTGRSA